MKGLAGCLSPGPAMNQRHFLVSLVLACWTLCAVAQPSAPAAAARACRRQHQQDIVAEFPSLLRIPTPAADAADIDRNASSLVSMLARRGVASRLLRTPGAP